MSQTIKTSISSSGIEAPVRVFVGADRSQALAVKVLEHSIRRNTTLRVEVHPMIDLMVRAPKNPLNGQRTGFSFSRFCIPKLAGYQGRAIYMDADMLVFRDIRELWELSFDGAKVIIQKDVKFQEQTTAKPGSPKVRRKQCAVMLLDCGRLDWDIDRIIDGLDAGSYDYEKLMYELCVLQEGEINYGVPFEWNSLEHYDADTRLLHYTDVYTQPWTSCKNKNADHWFEEVRRMLEDGSLKMSDLKEEVRLGYFRPSLLHDISYGRWVPSVLKPVFRKVNEAYDAARRYEPHREIYKAKRLREALGRQSQAAPPP